jgi:amidase
MSEYSQAREYHAAIDVLRKSRARVVHPVYITPPEKCMVEGETDVNVLMNDIIRGQVRAGCEYYLSTLDNPAVTDLAGIMEFNEANADIEFDDGA